MFKGTIVGTRRVCIVISLITSDRITSWQKKLYHSEARQIPEVMQQKVLQ